ncbi:MAG: type III secretion system cytoplasmic ring protein SctQ [Candidatus Symbiodolus clandestinus]
MWYPVHSSTWSALSQHIGGGRLHAEGQVCLTMERQGGEGIIWPLMVAGQSCQAWCTENAWCQWITPLLPVPGLAQIDSALLPPLALWSWQPWLECLASEQQHFQINTPIEGNISEDWGPHLSLRRPDKAELLLRLVGWPADWLMQQTRDWEKQANPSPVPSIAISVVAGWCSLPYSSINTLRSGEGLRLSGPVNLWRGEVWLFQQQPLARVRFTQTQQAEIEAVMAEISEWPAENSADFPALPVTLVAEIGQLWLSLEQLTQLQVGLVLQGNSAFTGEVRLKANGYHLGSGQLIEVGGHWVVQINHWFTETASVKDSMLDSTATVEALISPNLTSPVMSPSLTYPSVVDPVSVAQTDAQEPSAIQPMVITSDIEITAQAPVTGPEAKTTIDAQEPSAVQPMAITSDVELTDQPPITGPEAKATIDTEEPSASIHSVAITSEAEPPAVASQGDEANERQAKPLATPEVENSIETAALLAEQMAKKNLDTMALRSEQIEAKTTQVSQEVSQSQPHRPPRPPRGHRPRMSSVVKASLNKRRPPGGMS